MPTMMRPIIIPILIENIGCAGTSGKELGCGSISITNISAGKRDTLVRVYTKRDLLQMLQIMKYE